MRKIINSHSSIIFLNGTFSKELINLVNTKVPLIAADGSAKKVYELGLTPNFIVGDGDSYKKKSNENFIEMKTQDFTDFEKCVFFAEKNNLLPSLVLGINGGEFDHILGNALAMLKHSKNFSLYFLDTYEKNNNKMGIKLGIPLTKEKLKLFLENKTLLSIIPFQDAIVKTKGLKWNLKNKLLHVDDILAIRNENISKNIEIEVKRGKALLILDIKAKTFLKNYK
jgi:thiamine pyrophosphokinase